MAEYKLFISSAGTGSRLKAHTTYRNKGLLTLGLKPALAHIIEKFDPNIPIVIAVGYKKESLIEVVSEFFPDRDIQFVDVGNFDGPGSGLGLSMLQCEAQLQCPFVFVPNDTLIPNEDINFDPNTVGNWVGLKNNASGDIDPSHYRCAEISDNQIIGILPKGLTTDNIYVGLCGVKDFKDFWSAMKSSQDAITEGESFGLNMLNKKKAVFIEDWYDTGNLNRIHQAFERYASKNHNILPKKDEAIWISDGKCIKYHKDPDFIKDRLERIKYLPHQNLPKILNNGKNFFSYEYLHGELFSNSADLDTLKKLLDTMKKNLWDIKPDEFDKNNILQKQFYRDKTLSRVELYFNRFDQKDNIEKINGQKVLTVSNLLDRFDWLEFYSGVEWGRFHGDLHGENIIIEPSGNLKLLDWRQNFGSNNYEFGDVYYDLAKLMHGLIVRHTMVNRDRFAISYPSTTSVSIDIENSMAFFHAQRFLEEWIKIHGYNLIRVKKIVALIFLNIAALHHYPYSKFLFLLGQQLLNEHSKDE